jgi:hypothetical protein
LEGALSSVGANLPYIQSSFHVWWTLPPIFIPSHPPLICTLSVSMLLNIYSLIDPAHIYWVLRMKYWSLRIELATRYIHVLDRRV